MSENQTHEEVLAKQEQLASSDSSLREKLAQSDGGSSIEDRIYSKHRRESHETIKTIGKYLALESLDVLESQARADMQHDFDNRQKEPSPLVHEEGLGQEQQAEMIRLRQDSGKKQEAAQRKSQDYDDTEKRYNTQTPWDPTRPGRASVIDLGVGASWAERKANRAAKRDTKFYEQNTDAIQVQAVKDAAAEGYNTSFGTEDTSEHEKAA
jgi:hypothetical protein